MEIGKPEDSQQMIRSVMCIMYLAIVGSNCDIIFGTKIQNNEGQHIAKQQQQNAGTGHVTTESIHQTQYPPYPVASLVREVWSLGLKLTTRRAL